MTRPWITAAVFGALDFLVFAPAFIAALSGGVTSSPIMAAWPYLAAAMAGLLDGLVPTGLRKHLHVGAVAMGFAAALTRGAWSQVVPWWIDCGLATAIGFGIYGVEFAFFSAYRSSGNVLPVVRGFVAALLCGSLAGGSELWAASGVNFGNGMIAVVAGGVFLVGVVNGMSTGGPTCVGTTGAGRPSIRLLATLCLTNCAWYWAFFGYVSWLGIRGGAIWAFAAGAMIGFMAQAIRNARAVVREAMPPELLLAWGLVACAGLMAMTMAVFDAGALAVMLVGVPTALPQVAMARINAAGDPPLAPRWSALVFCAGAGFGSLLAGLFGVHVGLAAIAVLAVGLGCAVVRKRTTQVGRIADVG